jgi:hypothetical protein
MLHGAPPAQPRSAARPAFPAYAQRGRAIPGSPPFFHVPSLATEDRRRPRRRIRRSLLVRTDYSKLAQTLVLLGLDCQIQASDDQVASNVPVLLPDLTIVTSVLQLRVRANLAPRGSPDPRRATRIWQSALSRGCTSQDIYGVKRHSSQYAIRRSPLDLMIQRELFVIC